MKTRLMLIEGGADYRPATAERDWLRTVGGAYAMLESAIPRAMKRAFDAWLIDFESLREKERLLVMRRLLEPDSPEWGDAERLLISLGEAAESAFDEAVEEEQAQWTTVLTNANVNWNIARETALGKAPNDLRTAISKLWNASCHELETWEKDKLEELSKKAQERWNGFLKELAITHPL